MEENKNNEGINIVVEQVKFPSFREFCAINESVDAEMTLYSEIASRVDQLKQVYGEKAIAKTGMMKALLSVNELILTGKKENQPQAAQTPSQSPIQDGVQPGSQPGAQTQPPAQSQPPVQPQAQSTQPQAQEPEKK